jgi:hypothetical protein
MNIFDLTDTWNAGATTFTAIKMNVTDTASASGSKLLDLQVGGSSVFEVLASNSLSAAYVRIKGGGQSLVGLGSLNSGVPSVVVQSTGSYGWSTNSDAFSGTYDLQIHRDAADTLAQRNGTNAQAFRVYNTYTDASNYERTVLEWNSNTFYFLTAAAGTGTQRSMVIGTQGATNLNFATNNNFRWRVDSNGHFLAIADNTYDIGASGATRPRNLFLGGYAIINGALYLGANSSSIVAVSDGVFRLQNGAGTDFGRLQLGGTTSSFPALKRSSADLHVRLADDSAFAAVAGLVDLTATQAADSIGTRGVPQNSQSAAYTLVIEDAGKHILHPSADTTARTFTIPANGTVAFAVGTVVTFVNQNAGGVITIAITTDTMRLAGAGTTGSRTLAANGIATAIKVTSTEWLISGTGLT